MALVERDDYQDATAAADSATVQPGAPASYWVAVTGSETVGSTLRARVVDLPPAAGVRWQWRRGNATIAGATGADYRLQRRDYGRRIVAVATVRVSGYGDATASARAGRIRVSRLTLALGRSTVRVGGRVGIKVTGLVPGERWLLEFGNGTRVASGRAPASGRLVRTVRLPARATGVHPERRLRIVTSNPRRRAGLRFALVR